MSVIILEILVLVTALSADAFAAGFVYGAGRIKVPTSSLLILTASSSLVLALSLLAGGFAGRLLPGWAGKGLGFGLLAGVGLWKLFDRSVHREAKEADRNQDQLVSPREALVLGAALSADSLAAGIGAGAFRTPVLAAFAASFVVGAGAFLGGKGLGRCIASRCRSDFSWLSGFLLLALAFLKLL